MKDHPSKKAKKKNIQIRCKAADELPLESIEDFQKGLKKRGLHEIELIIKSIEKRGFSFPFFIWKNDGHNYCIDGHGRIEALNEMVSRGYVLPKFPVVYIEADSEADAREKLLALNSQFGYMTIETIAEFTSGMEIELTEFQLPDGGMFNFSDEVRIGLNDGEDDIEIGKDVEMSDKVCPNCGFILGKKMQKTGAKSYFGKDLNRDIH